VAGATAQHRVAETHHGRREIRSSKVVTPRWPRTQVELLDRRRWTTRIELANAIFEYLEIWHNGRRRHSGLGWLSPLEFENQSKIVVA